MPERRREHRTRTYLGGRIAFNNRWSTIGCVVRNLSENGAMLEFAEPAFVPSDLDLIIPLRGDSRQARVVWRNATALGLSFADRDADTVVSLEAERQIRRLKAERDLLARRVRELIGEPT